MIEIYPQKGATLRFFWKIDKGELYLVPSPSDDPDAKADYTGELQPVVVFMKAK